MRSVLKLAAISAIGIAGSVFALPGQAANAASTWDHNGSKVTLEENGTKRRIVYTEPRAALEKAGVKRGTVLFDGETKKGGRVAGYAKIFRVGCDPVDYFVEGSVDPQKGEMVLQGQAPVYSGKDCKITGYSDDDAASTLSFKGLSGPRDRDYADRDGGNIEQGDGGYSARDPGPGARASGDDRNTGSTSTGRTAPGDERDYASRDADTRVPPRDADVRDPGDRLPPPDARAPSPRDPADGDQAYDDRPRDFAERDYPRRPASRDVLPDEEIYPDDVADDPYYEPEPPVSRRRYYEPPQPGWRERGYGR